MPHPVEESSQSGPGRGGRGGTGPRPQGSEMDNPDCSPNFSYAPGNSSPCRCKGPLQSLLCLLLWGSLDRPGLQAPIHTAAEAAAKGHLQSYCSLASHTFPPPDAAGFKVCTRLAPQHFISLHHASQAPVLAGPGSSQLLSLPCLGTLPL